MRCQYLLRRFAAFRLLVSSSKSSTMRSFCSATAFLAVALRSLASASAKSCCTGSSGCFVGTSTTVAPSQGRSEKRIHPSGPGHLYTSVWTPVARAKSGSRVVNCITQSSCDDVSWLNAAAKPGQPDPAALAHAEPHRPDRTGPGRTSPRPDKESRSRPGT